MISTLLILFFGAVMVACGAYSLVRPPASMAILMRAIGVVLLALGIIYIFSIPYTT